MMYKEWNIVTVSVPDSVTRIEYTSPAGFTVHHPVPFGGSVEKEIEALKRTIDFLIRKH